MLEADVLEELTDGDVDDWVDWLLEDGEVLEEPVLWVLEIVDWLLSDVLEELIEEDCAAVEEVFAEDFAEDFADVEEDFFAEVVDDFFADVEEDFFTDVDEWLEVFDDVVGLVLECLEDDFVELVGLGVE